MKKTFIVTAILSVSLMGCSKEEQNSTGNYDESVTSFREMNIPKGFDFSGTRTVYANITKQEGVKAGARSIITIQDASGNMLLKYNADLTQDVEIPMEISANTRELIVVNAAGVKETIKISNNRLTIK